MARPAQAHIYLDAILANYRAAKACAPQARAIAIIKANAYGHGAVAVAHALAEEADAFGVACIEEALELRAAGIRQPICLLEGFFSAEEIPLMLQYEFIPAIHHAAQLALLAQYLPLNTQTNQLKVWLKLDSGMHRLGFAPEDLTEAYQNLRALPVQVLGLMTHFARADEITCPYTQTQWQRTQQWAQSLKLALCCANSPATLAWPSTHADWIRPGIMLYGATPIPEAQTPVRLRVGMRLSSQLISVRDLAAGEGVGYGHTFVTTQPSRIGVVAMGYADGYPRHAPSGTPVYLEKLGACVPLIGRVSMDMLTVDLSTCAQAQVGDAVELWGQHLPINQVAKAAQSIAYELLTKVTARVPRYYHY